MQPKRHTMSATPSTCILRMTVGVIVLFHLTAAQLEPPSIVSKQKPLIRHHQLAQFTKPADRLVRRSVESVAPQQPHYLQQQPHQPQNLQQQPHQQQKQSHYLLHQPHQSQQPHYLQQPQFYFKPNHRHLDQMSYHGAHNEALKRQEAAIERRRQTINLILNSYPRRMEGLYQVDKVLADVENEQHESIEEEKSFTRPLWHALASTADFFVDFKKEIDGTIDTISRFMRLFRGGLGGNDY